MAKSASHEKAQEIRPGSRISHYRVVRELGSGGMGVVYQARDENLGRDVALKCPRPDRELEKDLRRRFLREGRAAARLLHPHIVPVLEVFEHEQRPWLVMEYVHGHSLHDAILHRGALPPVEILHHAEGLADGLRVAHERGILHRDIKTTNILIGEDGRARLTDFGLVKFIVPPGHADSASTISSVTSAGGVVGTLAAMSPEQALGKPLSPASDIFSLGTVLYEMCTGTQAFKPSQDSDVLDAILNHEPAPISRMNYEVPQELERIIRKTLSKRVDERYQDAKDLLVDLRALRRQLESAEYGSDHLEPIRPSRRWPVLAAGSIGAAAALLVIVWFALDWQGDGDPDPPVAIPRQVTTAETWEAEGALSPDGSLVAYSTEIDGNIDIWVTDIRGGQPLRLTDDAAVDRNPAWFPDGASLAFVSERGDGIGIWRMPRLGGSATMLVPDAVDPALSPDGTMIAFASPGPAGLLRIGMASLVDPSAVVMLTHDDEGLFGHHDPAWSPDGETIAYSDLRDIWLVDVATKGTRRLTNEAVGDFEPAWSPDGRYVYFASYRGGTLAVWRVRSSGGTPQRVTTGSGPEREPSISRNGSRLAVSSYLEDPDLVLRDLQTGEETLMAGMLGEMGPAISPDRKNLVFVSNRWGESALWLQKLDAGRPVGPPKQLTDQPGFESSPAYSPDGEWIAYHRAIRGKRSVWVIPASGGVPVRFTAGESTDIHPAWSQDGMELGFSSDRSGNREIWVAPVAAGRAAGPARQVTHGDGTAWAPTWSPAGDRIAYLRWSGEGSEVWIVDADGNGAEHRVTDGAQAARTRWHPSGRQLYVSGRWGTKETTLRLVSTADGRATALNPPVVFGKAEFSGDFDLSRDGRLLVCTKEKLSGDLWVLEAEAGSY